MCAKTQVMNSRPVAKNLDLESVMGSCSGKDSFEVQIYHHAILQVSVPGPESQNVGLSVNA